MKTLIMLVLLGGALPAQSIREDNTPLRERCEATAPEMARLKQGTPVKLRLTVAAPSSACAAVTAEVEGRQLQGYLDKDALAEMDGFEEGRRQAAATQVRTATRPVTAKPAAAARAWPAAKPAFTRVPPKAPAKAVASPPPQPAPDFSFGTVSRQALLGKTYLLQFWAPWCKPCTAQMADFKRLYERHEDRKFEIVTVALDGQPNQTPWPQALAQGGFSNETARKFGVERLPATIVVDPEGRIVGRDLEGVELERALVGRR